MIVSKDDDNGVIFLTSEDETNRIRIDGVTTLVLYALRSYYEDKLKDNPAVNEIYLDSTGLKVLLKDLGLTTVNRRISALSLANSLRTLSMYSVITLAKGSLSEASFAFYILPSIRYVISNAKLNALYAAIQEINQEGANATGLQETIPFNDEAGMAAPDETNSAEEGEAEKGEEAQANPETAEGGEEK
jgi:hypothetical protein